MYKYASKPLRKTLRQTVIRELIDGESITSQAQLRTRLLERGIGATQATLSRDIRDLGLVKRTADGAYRSAASAASHANGDAAQTLARAAAEYLRSQEAVGHMLILKTDAGQAQTLAVALDRAHLAEIAGTIAGDDTVLVISRTPEAAATVAGRIAALRADR